MPEQLPEPATILVDSGYENMDQIAEVEQAGATVYCSMGQEREYHQSRYDFKPPKQKKLPRSKRSAAWPWPSV